MWTEASVCTQTDVSGGSEASGLHQTLGHELPRPLEADTVLFLQGKVCLGLSLPVSLALCPTSWLSFLSCFLPFLSPAISPPTSQA